MHITSDVIVASLNDMHVVLSSWKLTDFVMAELNGFSGLLGNVVTVTKRF